MTIKQLLSHTSGIGYSFTNPIEYALVAKTKKGEWELPLLDDPGTKFNYSASTRVLGLIVEKVTGSPLEPWYQEHIFKPLGMVDTSYAVAADKQSRLAPQFTRATGKMEPLPKATVATTPTAPFRGDGGLYSTVEDYSKFVRMLLNGGHAERHEDPERPRRSRRWGRTRWGRSSSSCNPTRTSSARSRSRSAPARTSSASDFRSRPTTRR